MKCTTEGCLNEAQPLRRICGKCRSIKYREKYPLKYWYNTLKHNARRRGKSFTLTIDQFETFCMKTGYDKYKGKTATSLSVDRIDNTLGYSMDNIRAITLSDNTACRYDPTYEPEEFCPF